jgi:hypothetical protein
VPVRKEKEKEEKTVGIHRLFAAALKRRRTKSKATPTIVEEKPHVPPTQNDPTEMSLEVRFLFPSSCFLLSLIPSSVAEANLGRAEHLRASPRHPQERFVPFPLPLPLTEADLLSSTQVAKSSSAPPASSAS